MNKENIAHKGDDTYLRLIDDASDGETTWIYRRYSHQTTDLMDWKLEP